MNYIRCMIEGGGGGVNWGASKPGVTNSILEQNKFLEL